MPETPGCEHAPEWGLAWAPFLHLTFPTWHFQGIVISSRKSHQVTRQGRSTDRYQDTRLPRKHTHTTTNNYIQHTQPHTTHTTTHIRAQPHTHTYMHDHTDSHTHHPATHSYLTHSLSHTHAQPHTHSHTFICTTTLSLSHMHNHILSHTCTHPHTHITHSDTHAPPCTHTITCTHPHTHTSHTHMLTFTTTHT